MASISKKVADRLAAGIKRFQSILADAKNSDIGEADTVRIVTEILADVLGYDQFKEITSELCVKSNRCDLAVKLDGKIRLPIEVKAIGFEFKQAHVDQAEGYAVHEGTDWAMLTNGVKWRIYAVTSGQPPTHDMIEEIDFLELNPKDEADLAKLYLFTKEALTKSVLEQHYWKLQAMSRFFLGAVILSDPVLAVVRRELRKVSPDVKIEVEEIRLAMTDEVLKRDVLDGERAEHARKKIAKSHKAKSKKDPETEKASTLPTIP